MRDNSLRGNKHLLRGGLFERLSRQRNDYDGPSVYHDLEDSMLSSIKRNLNNILNTRAGNALSSVGLGVGDFNDAQSSTINLSKTVCTDIKATIEGFEPRVSNVSVAQIMERDSPLRLHFKITGDVLLKDRSKVIEFDLLLEKGRSCKVF